ncbi:MAG: NADH-quinone oxidoreductase subunit J [Alphaproteobacteria bacterium]|nr:MAG: NADH-quinone oxidoreductase subunit J [Alphaproteobacteria bacterium]
MIIQALTFYLFATIAVAAGFMVIASRNPVHSVLYLILAFFTSGGLFVLMGAEFLAMIMLIVYIGAVAVLFLFVVMMLDINSVDMKQGFLQYLPIGGVIGAILAIELLFIVSSWSFGGDTSLIAATARPVVSEVGNTQSIGLVLYTDYIYAFQAAGIILLVAMIGAIVLTHRSRPGVKKQNITNQVHRTPESAVELKKIPPGQGI